MNVNSSFWGEIGQNNDGRTREVLQKHIILNTDHQLEFFKHSISVIGYFPILCFVGPYSVETLPKIWTPSLEFTMSKEMIMFNLTIHNI